MKADQARLGVDTGGTFTDFVWLDRAGKLQIHKQLSTPADPSESILTGIELLGVGETAVIHGSTVATNALLERRGAKTALITTAGFADILAIGRQNRPDLYALVPQKPEPLVPAKWRFEVPERVTAEGMILHPLNVKDLKSILAQLQVDGFQSVAVCLLFSFLRPAHERQIRDYLMAADHSYHITLSSDILPEYREFERTAATVINAYVAPLMSRYLNRLADGLGNRPLTVMQSNGGIIQAKTAGEQAARTVLSGPAGGVVGARFVAESAGFPEIITFDMGGTSSDVASCPGRLPVTAENEIAGLPLRLPMIDIHTVGAGGGSLAYVDAGGALHVGPQSAGANPGPACYGRQHQNLPEVGTWVTTTDANLVLGRLDADHFLGGKMRLEEGLARNALNELAGEMGISGSKAAETAAWGVIQVANANMERAIRRISVERGYDPRLFTLVAFGGAGPLHACEMATNLQIGRVLIPAVPGVLSALGMLVAAPTRDYSQTVMRLVDTLDDTFVSWVAETISELEERAQVDMTADGYSPEALTMQPALDMRYTGQSHELTVTLDRNTDYRSILDLFHAAHEKRYGYKQPEEPVEIVTVRLTAVASSTPPQFEPEPLVSSQPERAEIGQKRVWFNERPVETRQYDRGMLQPGDEFVGAAVIYQYDTTTVIPPGWKVKVDAFRNLIVTRVSV